MIVNKQACGTNLYIALYTIIHFDFWNVLSTVTFISIFLDDMVSSFF